MKVEMEVRNATLICAEHLHHKPLQPFYDLKTSDMIICEAHAYLHYLVDDFFKAKCHYRLNTSHSQPDVEFPGGSAWYR